MKYSDFAWKHFFLICSVSRKKNNMQYSLLFGVLWYKPKPIKVQSYQRRSVVLFKWLNSLLYMVPLSGRSIGFDSHCKSWLTNILGSKERDRGGTCSEVINLKKYHTKRNKPGVQESRDQRGFVINREWSEWLMEMRLCGWWSVL